MVGITQAEWLEKHQEDVKRELLVTHKHPEVPADIIIVAHNGLEHLKACVESVRANTPGPHALFIYDNGSDEETREWVNRKSGAEYAHFAHENRGFIEPNNYLASRGQNPYLVLLNSDTVVQSPLWLRAMTSHLIEYPQIGVVGMRGGILGEDGKGEGFGFGWDVDYIEGWCLCLSRETHFKHGLFDEQNLKFAYGEDADLSLRLREAGLLPYALHLDCVFHHGNVTAKEVAKTLGPMMKKNFEANHAYLKTRWADYFKTGRVKVRGSGDKAPPP